LNSWHYLLHSYDAQAKRFASLPFCIRIFTLTVRPTRSGVLLVKAQRRKVSARAVKGQNGPFTPETPNTDPFSPFLHYGRVVSGPKMSRYQAGVPRK